MIPGTELTYVVLVVEPGHVSRARELAPKGVEVCSTEHQGAIVGRRFHLVLRTSRPDPRPAEGSFDWHLAMRTTQHARLVVGDLESLVAILGAIREVAPWVLRGLPGRSAEAWRPPG